MLIGAAAELDPVEALQAAFKPDSSIIALQRNDLCRRVELWTVEDVADSLSWTPKMRQVAKVEPCP